MGKYKQTAKPYRFTLTFLFKAKWKDKHLQ